MVAVHALVLALFHLILTRLIHRKGVAIRCTQHVPVFHQIVDLVVAVILVHQSNCVFHVALGIGFEMIQSGQGRRTHFP